MQHPGFRRRWLGLIAAAALGLAPATAQTPPPGGGPTPAEPAPTSVSLDGGAALLLAAGTAYALRRLRRPARP